MHPDSDAIISFLRQDNALDGCMMLSGVDGNPWGMPIYWAKPTDREYEVVPTRWQLPPEFAALRIPAGAAPMATSDGEMVIYDLAKGYVAFVWTALYDPAADRWSAGGGSVAYLDSNGLEGRLRESDDPRNGGSHRGLNGAVSAVRFDEVAAGAIRHVLKVGVHTVRSEWVFPMTGSDGTTTRRDAPAQGARLRIRPSVDLDRFGLHPQARVIATALQRYGAIVGDSTGAPIELKLEDTLREGRGQLWALSQLALCAIPIEAFEVVADGYVPPSPGIAEPIEAPLGTACPAPVPEDGFEDIDGTHESAVDCVVAWGIASGVGQRAYQPAVGVTRAQMASFMVRTIRAAGTGLNAGPDAFDDDGGNVHEEAINALAAAGIVRGTGSGTYEPGRLVTRAQMATFLARSYELVSRSPLQAGYDRFADDAGDIHEADINKAAEAGFATGVEPGVFRPDRQVRRDQMGSFIARMLDRFVSGGLTSVPYTT